MNTKLLVISSLIMVVSSTIIITISYCQQENLFKLNFQNQILDHLNNGPINKIEQTSLGKSKVFLKISNELLLNIIPVILGQRACNENGSREEFKNYLLNDDSNDEIAKSSPQEIIKRSGYSYENYNVVSDDGYSTQLIRIVNPLVNRKDLKQPPVMLMHGGILDPTIFISSSAIEHHPEKYPRSLKEDGPITSWNRSIGFFLANHGYDVWLVTSRGSINKPKSVGQLITRGESVKTILMGHNKLKNMTFGQDLLELINAPKYWAYSFDEIIQHEVPNQIKKVLKVTKSKGVTIFAYSFSTMIMLPFLATRPDIAHMNVHNLIVMAPIINEQGVNSMLGHLYKTVCIGLSDELANFFSTEWILTKPIRSLLINLGKSFRLRYGLLKFVLYLFQGPSAQYLTLLEPPIYGHLFGLTSLMQIKHYCQQVLAHQYQHFDFGKLKNLLVYGQEEPPIYNITKINVPNWLLISALNDNIATQASTRQIVATVRPEPRQHIQIPGYAHLDLIAAIDNGAFVNKPILSYLDEYRSK